MAIFQLFLYVFYSLINQILFIIEYLFNVCYNLQHIEEERSDIYAIHIQIQQIRKGSCSNTFQ